ALPVAMGLSNAGGAAPKTFVLERGELGSPGDEGVPGFPLVLHSPEPLPPARRTALSNWLSVPANPLTARVLVNRLWQHHVGLGLVATPNDSGIRGERPTHPELLDWLATEFVENGWSVKHLHRLLLLSATYQQSSKPSPTALARDPENRLLSRMNRLRL